MNINTHFIAPLITPTHFLIPISPCTCTVTVRTKHRNASSFHVYYYGLHFILYLDVFMFNSNGLTCHTGHHQLVYYLSSLKIGPIIVFGIEEYSSMKICMYVYMHITLNLLRISFYYLDRIFSDSTSYGIL